MELRKYGMRRFNVSGSPLTFFQFLFCIFLGIVGSKFFFIMSPLLVLGAAGGLLLLIISIYKPEIGILSIVVLLSSIIYESALPLIPIPLGSLHVSDVILLSLIFMIAFKLFADRSFRLSQTPLDKPLLLFYIGALISVFTSVFSFKLDFNVAVREFRLVSYYLLIYFVITNLIREKRQIKFVIRGLFVIATIVGLAMIIQAIVGRSIQLMAGIVEEAGTLGQVYEATRIRPPGQTLIYVVFITAVCAIAFINKPLLKSSYFYILLIAGIGVLLTYNRNYWITIIFSLSIFMIMTSKRDKKRVIAWFVIVAILISALSFSFFSIGGRPQEYLVSISDRFASLFAGEKIFHSATLNWRRTESEYALRQIAKNPLFGIGLANDYRSPILRERDWVTRYIHNGYLWIILKMGFIGFLPFIWFYIRFLFRGFSNWKKIEDAFLKSAVTGFVLSGIGISISVLISPMFMEWHAIVVIATMIGITEAIININEREIKKLSE